MIFNVSIIVGIIHCAFIFLKVMVRASTLRTTVGSNASSSWATTTPSHIGPSSIGSDLPSSPHDTAGNTQNVLIYKVIMIKWILLSIRYVPSLGFIELVSG